MPRKPKGWMPGTYYRLGDKHSSMKFMMDHYDANNYASIPKPGKKFVQAIWGGEYRCPKKGEWYLSGCEGFVCAYKAPNDLSTIYFIAEIVQVESSIKIKTIKHLDN